MHPLVEYDLDKVVSNKNSCSFKNCEPKKTFHKITKKCLTNEKHFLKMSSLMWYYPMKIVVISAVVW